MTTAKLVSSIHTRVEGAPGSLVICDKRGSVVYTNPATSHTTGFSLSEIIGGNPGKLWGGHMPKPFYRQLWTTVRTQKKPFIGEVLNTTKAGQPYQEYLSLTPLLDAHGETAYILHITPPHHTTTKQKFQNDFFSLFSSSAGQLASSFERTIDWLTGSAMEKPDCGPELPPTAESFLSIILRTLIEPTNQQFHYREQENSLVTEAQEHEEGFGKLYTASRNRIMAYLLRRVGNLDIAEDLTQETFVRAFAHIHTFRVANAAYHTFLLRIAHNLLIDYYRRDHHCASLEDVHVLALSQKSTVEERLMAQALWERISALLPPLDVDILRQHYEKGLLLAEIAQNIHKSENAVKLHLSRARKKLITLL